MPLIAVKKKRSRIGIITNKTCRVFNEISEHVYKDFQGTTQAFVKTP